MKSKKGQLHENQEGVAKKQARQAASEGHVHKREQLCSRRPSRAREEFFNTYMQRNCTTRKNIAQITIPCTSDFFKIYQLLLVL